MENASFSSARKANRIPVIIGGAVLAVLLTVAVLLLTGVLSKENKLVGEWQSNKPESVHLTIAQGGKSSDGFYYGFSYTENGQTYAPGYWKIDERNDGIFLSLGWRADRPWDGTEWIRDERRHKVIELASDRFVVEWGDNRHQVEFQRVK